MKLILFLFAYACAMTGNFWLTGVCLLGFVYSLGPAKAHRQACWYCNKGHEHKFWLHAKICDLVRGN